ncbi:DUF2605 domain-containing protein [Phormidesmis priestleyi]
MLHSNLPEPDILKTVLEPLLEDFQYWFTRSRALLENQEIPFLGNEKQANLLERVLQAHQEVNTVRTLLNVTEGQVGVETPMLMTWHQLVAECWQVSMRLRSEKSA